MLSWQTGRQTTFADLSLKSPTPTSRRVSPSNARRLGRPAVCLTLSLTSADRRVALSRTSSSRGVASAFMTPGPRSLPTGRHSRLHRTRSPSRCKYYHQRHGNKLGPLSDLTVFPSPGLRQTLIESIYIWRKWNLLNLLILFKTSCCCRLRAVIFPQMW